MNAGNPKILIVDNEVEICNLFKDFFDFIGYESEFETDGEKVLGELENYDYDLMFVDLKLDTVSGVDILRKSKRLHPSTEIIVVTGFGSEETVLSTLHYGATSYIQKPISFSDIRVQTRAALANRSLNLKTERLKQAIGGDDSVLKNHMETILNLDKLSQFLNLTIDIDMLGDSILNGIAEIIPASYYSFFFHDKINREMVFYSPSPIDKPMLGELEGKCRGALESFSNKTADDDYNVRVSRTSEVEEGEAGGSIAGLEDIFAPILIENTISGVLGVTGDFGDRSEDFEDVLYIISSRVSRVLANATLHRDTKLLALTDGLTGLLNHRAFHDRLTQEFERYRRYGSYLSLIVADFDDLKKFNDNYGHPVGDEVLRIVGEILRKASRDSDVLARYGGDEFVILLPQTNAENAYNMAERIRMRISEYEFNINGNSFRSSISMGLATVPNVKIDTPQDFLEMADQALYEAKRGGKNRINTAPSPE